MEKITIALVFMFAATIFVTGLVFVLILVPGAAGAIAKLVLLVVAVIALYTAFHRSLV